MPRMSGFIVFVLKVHGEFFFASNLLAKSIGLFKAGAPLFSDIFRNFAIMEPSGSVPHLHLTEIVDSSGAVTGLLPRFKHI